MPGARSASSTMLGARSSAGAQGEDLGRSRRRVRRRVDQAMTLQGQALGRACSTTVTLCCTAGQHLRPGPPPVTAEMPSLTPTLRGPSPSPRGVSMRRAARALLAAGALAWRAMFGSTKDAHLCTPDPWRPLRGEVLSARHHEQLTQSRTWLELERPCARASGSIMSQLHEEAGQAASVKRLCSAGSTTPSSLTHASVQPAEAQLLQMGTAGLG